MRSSNSLENKTPSVTYWRVQLVFKKVLAHSSLEPHWNTIKTKCLRQIKVHYDLFIRLGSYGNIMHIWVIKFRVLRKVFSKQFCFIRCSFKLVLEGKTGKEIPESPRLEFLEKFSANNFALSDAEDKTSGPLNREAIADLLLLRTL